MSDIDYQQLFLNGQLIMAEAHHLEILDRMYRATRGTPEEAIFMNKYRSYLDLYHPEDTAPVARPVAEPVVPAEEAPEPTAPVEQTPDDVVAPEATPPQDSAPVEASPPVRRRGGAIISPK